MRKHVDNPRKEAGRPSGGTRKSRMVLAAFVPESPAHRRKLQGFCDSRAVGVTAAQELLGRDPASISFVAPALDWVFFETRKESFISTVEADGRNVLVWSIGDKGDRLAERRRREPRRPREVVASISL